MPFRADACLYSGLVPVAGLNTTDAVCGMFRATSSSSPSFTSWCSRWMNTDGQHNGHRPPCPSNGSVSQIDSVVFGR